MWGTKLAPERTPAAPWELQQRWRWAGVDRSRLMATCVGQVGRHSLRCGTQGENLEMKDAPVTVYVSHLVVCPDEHQKPSGSVTKQHAARSHPVHCPVESMLFLLQNSN